MQHHNDQVMNFIDCAKKLDDFMESMEQVEPEYQQLALSQCCAVLEKHMKKQGII